MDVEEFAAILALLALVVIPALALTARFTLKPIVEAIIGLREGLMGRRPDEDVQRRLAMIEAELADLGSAVRRLADVHEYDRKLASGAARDSEP